MPITPQGTGTVTFEVTSVVLYPAHMQAPIYDPSAPMPTPYLVPEKVLATLTPVNPADPEATVGGTMTISTEDIGAFAIGAAYAITIAVAVE